MAYMIYGFIMKAELLFLRFYKVNPFDIMEQITLVDLNAYVNEIQEAEKKERESIKNSKLVECLRNINDYLNVMFYKK